jgi:universal stress protein A
VASESERLMKLEHTRGNGKQAVASDFPNLPNVTNEGWLRPHPRFRIKKILAPVDFSEPSEKGLQYALSIAQEFGSEIVLVHVVQPYPVLPEMPVPTDELTEALLSDANARLNELKERIKDVPCTVRAPLGSPANRILEIAQDEAVDLIVLGTHGRTGLAHAFLGSVAERVVRLASCPTLVVRAQERDFVVVHADDAEANRRGQKPATAQR